MLEVDVTLLAFGAGMVAVAGILGLLVVTLATDRQLWPPGDRTWAYYLHWSLVGLFNISIVAAAITDWNSWLLARPASLVVGIVLSVTGAAVFVRSAGVMDADEVSGVTGDLYTEGPYAYSRNPQYVGMIVGLVGFALAVNSPVVAALAAAHVGWVLLLPLAEEPHLRAEYGTAYERYAARVPRFVGLRTLRRFRRELAGEPTE